MEALVENSAYAFEAMVTYTNAQTKNNSKGAKMSVKIPNEYLIIIENCFWQLSERNPKVSAQKVLNTAEFKCKQQGLNPDKLPKVRKVQLLLKALKQTHSPGEKASNVSKPFSLGTLLDHPLPPETLPVVLEIWAQYRKDGQVMTIREAAWVSRLSSVLEKFEKLHKKDLTLYPGMR
jgi:hypothetical protein